MRRGNGNPRTGIRLTTLAASVVILGFSGFTKELHAESNQAGARNAALHISVVVMPVVQALNIPQPQRQSGPVTYNVRTEPIEKRYEVRSLPGGITARDKQAPAILETLVLVPQ
ncbi:MAG: hypothetical protein DMG63_04640 [Acidobacteria bacterium]|nr:MAG: hypothetical protein DMG63_04640 [Acidobacteriota bacterium]